MSTLGLVAVNLGSTGSITLDEAWMEAALADTIRKVEKEYSEKKKLNPPLKTTEGDRIVWEGKVKGYSTTKISNYEDVKEEQDEKSSIAPSGT